MSTEAPAPGAIHTSEDEQILHRLGYAQELFRAMGVFRNFAISFTIISILAGCLTSYYLAFQWGGPVAVTWGWLIVGVFTTFVALSMAEIASTYPDRRRPLLLVVQARQPGVGLVHRLVQPDRPDRDHRRRRLRPRDLRDGVLQPALELPERHPPHLLSLRRLHARRALLVNVFDVRITSLLNAISAYWHVIGVADHRVRAASSCPTITSPRATSSRRRSTTRASGHTWGVWPFVLVFVIGSIGMAQYTLTGYDASAHMSEETHKASRSAAVGMIWSVIVSVIAGFILLVAITFAIPSTDRASQAAVHLHHDLHLADLDGHALGRGPALHRRLSPSSSA